MSTSQPEFLFFSINEICNLRCQHCNYWRAEQPSLDVISIARQDEILAEFAELSPHGKVVICGGEPMLDVGPYFQMCSTARALGLRILSVINGTIIVSASGADKVVTQGPDEISVSLDGPFEAIHDRMRGCKGAFQRATNAVKLLVEARARLGQTGLSSAPKIYVMGLLTRSSYPHLDEFYDLVLNQLGADKLKLNALQPTFLHTRTGQDKDNDDFFATESQIAPKGLLEELLKCNEKYNLNFNPLWIEQVVSYFRGLNGSTELHKGWKGRFITESHICNSPDRNIMVDLTGKASLCFSSEFPQVQLRVTGDMRKFWEESGAIKARMARCNALCGISHSVRREHATLSPTRTVET